MKKGTAAAAYGDFVCPETTGPHMTRQLVPHCRREVCASPLQVTLALQVPECHPAKGHAGPIGDQPEG